MLGAAASSKLKPHGLLAIICAATMTCVPKLPGASPKHASPAEKPAPAPADTAKPAQSAPGGPGSPGYKPSTFNTSRKLSPTACTATSNEPGDAAPVCTATARSPASDPRGSGSRCNAGGLYFAELLCNIAEILTPPRLTVPYRLSSFAAAVQCAVCRLLRREKITASAS